MLRDKYQDRLNRFCYAEGIDKEHLDGDSENMGLEEFLALDDSPSAVESYLDHLKQRLEVNSGPGDKPQIYDTSKKKRFTPPSSSTFKVYRDMLAGMEEKGVDRVAIIADSKEAARTRQRIWSLYVGAVRRYEDRELGLHSTTYERMGCWWFEIRKELPEYQLYFPGEQP